jgi:hypothetical protein
VGLADSWSIRTVTYTGTDELSVLAEERGAEPLYLHGWRTVGGKIVFVLVNGAGTGFPDSTELVSYDPATGVYEPLLIGRYRTGQMGIVAVDATHVYVRGFSRDAAHEIGRVALAGGDATYETLLSENRADRDIAEPGLVLNGRLYFWSRKQGEPHRLLSLPATGGSPAQILEGKFGVGLSTDGTQLYWVKDGKLLCMPPTGGVTPATLARNLFYTASLGGLPIRGRQVYFVRRLSRTKYRIERIPLPN